LQTLQHTATHCNTLQHTATHCNTLQHTATHTHLRTTGEKGLIPQPRSHRNTTTTRCNTLQHTRTCALLAGRFLFRNLYQTMMKYNTLQHAATHCNTLQHAATRCKTRLPALHLRGGSDCAFPARLGEYAAPHKC